MCSMACKSQTVIFTLYILCIMYCVIVPCIVLYYTMIHSSLPCIVPYYNMTHGMYDVKIVSAQQAKTVNFYRNIRFKLSHSEFGHFP
jgi:hypothetical protein